MLEAQSYFFRLMRAHVALLSVLMSLFRPTESMFCNLQIIIDKRKSFLRGAKATRCFVATCKASKGLAMAFEMLPEGQTKWRATGYSEDFGQR